MIGNGAGVMFFIGEDMRLVAAIPFGIGYQRVDRQPRLGSWQMRAGNHGNAGRIQPPAHRNRQLVIRPDRIGNRDINQFGHRLDILMVGRVVDRFDAIFEIVVEARPAGFRRETHDLACLDAANALKT